MAYRRVADPLAGALRSHSTESKIGASGFPPEQSERITEPPRGRRFARYAWLLEATSLNRGDTPREGMIRDPNVSAYT